MRKLGIRHIGIVTDNPDEMVLFYEKLGFKKVWDKVENVSNLIGKDYDVRAIKLSSNNGVQIELVVFDETVHREKVEYENIGISHISITVDNIDSILNELDFKYKEPFMVVSFRKSLSTLVID